MMKASQILTLFLATCSVNAASLADNNALDLLDAHGANAPRSDIFSSKHALERRKGGGGKGGGGGGGKSGGGTGGASRSSPSSNSGGSTKQGSGPARSYGGAYYGGGASKPYTAGGKTPSGLVPGVLLGGAAAFVIFPGIWLYSVYPYYYNNPYHFYNQSFQNATQQGLNQTLPVTCLCEEYSVCGCDENSDQKYLNDLVGNGSYAALNKTLVTVSKVNDTVDSLVINGSLPNGTTAPGGDEDANSVPGLADALPFGKFTGYYVMASLALYAVVLL